MDGRRAPRAGSGALLGLALAALLVVAIGLPPSVGSGTSVIEDAAPVPRWLRNPQRSLAPSPAYVEACINDIQDAACDRAALADIDVARRREGLGPLVLPWNFERLPVHRQLDIVTNAERASRRLPALPASSVLSIFAERGARRGVDPVGPSAYTWASNISWNYPTVLAADFAWMYDDGPGGTNVGCTATAHSGCWLHRRNILAPWRGALGTGVFAAPSGMRLTELIVAGYP